MRLKSTWKEHDMNKEGLMITGENFSTAIWHNTFGPKRSLMLSIPYRIIVGLNEEIESSK